MSLPKSKILHTDLLIIGGGAAGCMAGISAKDSNPELSVTIIEKAGFKSCGSIGRGMDRLNYVVPPSNHEIENLVKLHNQEANGIFNEKLARTLAENGYSILKLLEKWGINFPKDPKGTYRALGPDIVMDGAALKEILNRQVHKRNVQVTEWTMITKLLTTNQHVVGATGINTRTGEFTIYRAKNIILAAGSAARFGYPPSGYLFGVFDCPACAGDGFSLAYQAGAELKNMECLYVLPIVKEFAGPAAMFFHHGGILTNKMGEPIKPSNPKTEKINKWDSWAEDNLQLRIWKELEAGNGPIKIQLSHLPSATIDSIMTILTTVERPTFGEYLTMKGINLQEDGLEISLSEPFLCGGHSIAGVAVDTMAKTNIEGLYVVGDTASTHSYLPGALYLGQVAGKHAAKHQTSDYLPLSTKQIDQESQRIQEHTGQKSDFTALEIEQTIRLKVNKFLQSPKTGEKLHTLIQQLPQLRSNLKLIQTQDPHELMRCFELYCILDCVEMSARASLYRKESRWGLGHYRSDFPRINDDDWLCYVMIKKNAKSDEMCLFQRAIENSNS